jgi:Ribonuclease G/E
MARMEYALQPVKASLIADLVELININLADLLQVTCVTCPDCHGRGVVGGEAREGAVIDDGTLQTCATCGGVGAIERFVLDTTKLKTYRFGRLIEGFEYKQGQIIPKVRSKDKAFAMLVKLLGFDKAIVEIANASSIVETLSNEQRDAYVEQLKEMAQMGLLDGPK